MEEGEFTSEKWGERPRLRPNRPEAVSVSAESHGLHASLLGKLGGN